MSAPPRTDWREALALLALAISALCCLAVSWRSWPDPLIDAGHQLYVAWRLHEGDILNRELAYLYGPLSAHLNALLYCVFGTGMMVLVTANLVVYTAIAALSYRVFRAVFGVVGAVTAVGVFIWVFSFNQLIPVGNYTYALPYAHESTHGLLVVLALLPVSARWSERGRPRDALVTGLLCGLTLVLKPEFMLVASALVVVVVAVRILRGVRFGAGEIVVFAAAGAAPTLLFVGWFWRVVPLRRAFEFAGRGWWAVLVDSAHATVWGSFSGTDAWLSNLQREVLAGAALLAGGTLMWLGGRLVGRGQLLGALLYIAPIAAGVALSGRTMSVGAGVPCVMIALLIWRVSVIARRRRTFDSRDVLALMLIVAATVMLARMVLQARIYHFGFYQAALAAMVVSAAATTWLPEAVGAGARGSLWMRSGPALVIGSVAYHAFARSSAIFALHTLPVGTGQDSFFAYAPNVEPTGMLVTAVVDELKSNSVDARVLVVPEGLMINYLARRVSPIPEWALLDVTLQEGGEARIVERLQRKPPELVVFITRDLREHGITRFGGRGQRGEALVAWITANYEPVRSWGADPFDVRRRGAVVLRRSSRPAER